jgi:hypothetical protein
MLVEACRERCFRWLAKLVGLAKPAAKRVSAALILVPRQVQYPCAEPARPSPKLFGRLTRSRRLVAALPGANRSDLCPQLHMPISAAKTALRETARRSSTRYRRQQ